MPGGRRNAKSKSFKHHARSAESDRHELPKQPQVIPPKHIPVPNLPSSSDLSFEFDSLFMGLSAMCGQYINLYKTVFWLPNSYRDYALNFHLIDYYLAAINVIMITRRLPVCFLKELCKLCFPASYQASCAFYVQIFTMATLVPALLFCYYNVMLEQGFACIIFLVYPFIVYVAVVGLNYQKFLDLRTPPPEQRNLGAKSKGSVTPKNNGMITHVCSMSAETIRQEVETLRIDFNNRWKQVLFNTFVVTYHGAFLPCFYAQPTLHYNLNWAIQHGVLTALGCLTLYIPHCFPPKYCDVLHRAALHLGRWQRVEIKNLHVPYSNWTESSMWNQGALVKHSKELFKAEGISNAAVPGNLGQSKFYSLFKNPSIVARSVWLFQLLLISAEIIILIQSNTWNDMIPIQLLILMNFKSLYETTKVYFVVKKIYHEERILIAKFSN